MYIYLYLYNSTLKLNNKDFTYFTTNKPHKHINNYEIYIYIYLYIIIINCIFIDHFIKSFLSIPMGCIGSRFHRICSA